MQPYAISRDSPWTHIAWSQALDLEVPLLSDWNGEATRAFDVAHDFRGFREISARSVFIVDRDAVVRYARLLADDELPDLDETLAAASALAGRRAGA